MRIRSIFVAYPYKIGREYRETLESKFKGTGVEFRYADDELENAHVMQKICRMMSEADVCMFDVSDNNPNVLFELGYALGAQEAGFVVIRENAVQSLSADLTGWDQLRYSDIADLAEKVYERVDRVRIPDKRRPESISAASISLRRSTREILGELRFGIPRMDAPMLLVYVVPIEYRRHYKDRTLLGTVPWRPRDLCDLVGSAINETQYRTYFWPMGFNYDEPGPDFIEVFDGRGEPHDRSVNYRVYTSGVITYMQRLRDGKEGKPFMYRYMFDEIVEMALVAAANTRATLGFEEQGRVEVGTVFLGADEVRISEARRDFIPMADKGMRFIDPSSELWVPGVPLSVGSSEMREKAKDLAGEMSAYLKAELTPSGAAL